MPRYRKTAPIHPEQLTTERVDCFQCQRSHVNEGQENICKCYSCGICTEDFIRGAVLEVYSKHSTYPVVLIENVNCPGIMEIPEFQEQISKASSRTGFTRFKPDGLSDGLKAKLKDYFFKRSENNTVKIYHVFDLSDYYSPNSCGQCIERREKDPQFNEECFQHDLDAAADIMSGRADGEKKYIRKTYDGIETPVYSYYCNRNDHPLIELAFPVLIDGFCVAVMIIGQIDANPTDDLEKAMENNAKKAEDIAKCADIFSKRMQARTDIRKTDYYYRKLSWMYDEISKMYSNNDSISDVIKDVYHKIGETFDYQELAVLYTDKEAKAGFSFCWFPREKVKGDTFSLEQLCEAVYSDDEQTLLKLFGAENDDTVSFYRQHSHSVKNEDAVDCFILTFVRWKRKESIDAGNFFNALNARLFSLLLTKLALEKQKEADDQKTNQDILIESFSHDLNQKLEIIGSHTRQLDAAKEYWWIARDSWAFEEIRNYIKDINNLEMQLRHFTKEVRDNKSGLPTTKEVSVFKPYGQFLFNLKEYYDSLDAVRKLYMPSAPSVALNVLRYPALRADPVLIERLVNNLLSNAFKYSYRYTNIYLDCYKEGENYYIVVTNFSSPIKEDVRNHMFDPGVSQSIVRNYKRQKGKGIGLSNVQRICELHGGKVEYLPEEMISKYNVPVLDRLMRELYAADEEDKLHEKLAALKLAESDYAGIADEYSRLRRSFVSKEENNVAFLAGVRTRIEEICKYNSEYAEKLTAPYLRMALRTPTVRIRFKITLPQ